MATFHIITIFPQIFDSYINESIIKRAQEDRIIRIIVHNLRDYTKDTHKTVDDTPFGGGAGMVMKIKPIFDCLKSIEKDILTEETRDKKQETNKSQETNLRNQAKPHVILLTAKGKTYNQRMAQELTQKKNIVLICGRYEGVDHRVHDNLVDETISIGNYILTGGEIPALTILDSVTRLLPGVLGNEESAKNESFSQGNNIEYPQYTRPADFKGLKVPDILLSGNHQEIKKWRDENGTS